ncbi:unknown [Proteobacteria bacterium CAG:495]|nr:unknown [Proteobacteria bacterium CAG:495]
MIRRFFAVGFGFANLIQNLFHIAGTVGNGNPHLCTFNVDFGFLDAFQPFYFGKINFTELFAGNIVISRPQSRSHNAAGRTKNRSRAGILAQRAVGLFIFQIPEIDAGLLYHPA